MNLSPIDAGWHILRKWSKCSEISWLFQNDVWPRVKESFWAYRPENRQSLTKDYKSFETKIISFDLFQNLIYKNSNDRSNLNHWCFGIFLSCCMSLSSSKIDKSNIFEYDLFWCCHRSVQQPPKAKSIASVTSPGYQMKVRHHSYYMRCCFLI